MTNKAIDQLKQQVDVHFKNDYFNKRNPHPGETLLETLDYCFKNDIAVPEWAKIEYRKSYAKYRKRNGSEPLRMAFDTDPEAGKQRESKRRKQHHLNTVYHTLMNLHINEAWPIDKALFEEVARRHGNLKGLSGRTVEDWFYSDIKQMLSLIGGFPIYPGFVKPGSQKD